MTLPECLAFLAANPKRFYVYAMHRPCGTPFYVGKGTGDRVSEHSRPSKATTNQLRARVMAKIISDGGQIGYSIAGQFDLEDEAFAEERRLIALHGRRDLGTGYLTNLTGGGDGACNPSPGAIARRVVGLKAAMKKPGAKAVAMKNLRGHRDKAEAAIRVALNRPEFKARKSLEMSHKWQDKSFRAKLIAGTRLAQTTEKWRSRQAAGIARIQSDPSFHERRNAGLAKVRDQIMRSLNTPECLAKKSALAKAQRARQERERTHALQLAESIGIPPGCLPDRRSSFATWCEVISDLKLFTPKKLAA